MSFICEDNDGRTLWITVFYSHYRVARSSWHYEHSDWLGMWFDNVLVLVRWNRVCFCQFMTPCGCNSQPRWLSGLMRSRVHSLWLLVDHCVLRNWDRILVRAVKGLISRAGMVSICPLLWQRDVKLQQTITTTCGCNNITFSLQAAHTTITVETYLTLSWTRLQQLHLITVRSCAMPLEIGMCQHILTLYNSKLYLTRNYQYIK